MQGDVSLDGDEGQGATATLGHRRNWWKIGFFVMLFLFEIAREFGVLNGAGVAWPNVSFSLHGDGGYGSATGSWKRADGGSPIVPAAVTIQCWRSKKQCIEATTTMKDRYVFGPSVEYFDAVFTPDAITYENDDPDCAKYSVRLDFARSKVSAVRARNENSTNAKCANLEKRVEMVLANGDNPDLHPFAGRFVPLIQMLNYLVRTFDPASRM